MTPNDNNIIPIARINPPIRTRDSKVLKSRKSKFLNEAKLRDGPSIKKTPILYSPHKKSGKGVSFASS